MGGGVRCLKPSGKFEGVAQIRGVRRQMRSMPGARRVRYCRINDQ